MADVVDVIYRLRDMAGIAAQKLRGEIAEAQAVLDKLDAFATDAEDVGQLAAASELFPTYSALIPDRAGLVLPEGFSNDHCDRGPCCLSPNHDGGCKQ